MLASSTYSTYTHLRIQEEGWIELEGVQVELQKVQEADHRLNDTIESSGLEMRLFCLALWQSAVALEHGMMRMRKMI